MKIIPGREKDLGGFVVRRVLPFAQQRMVGPFIFLDHMGPAQFAAGQGIGVRPHPHIHLATVTYLFKGSIHHRDSLGSNQLIEPGAMNWMTAGRGIVHSERAPEHLKDQATELDGIQCWVALPEEKQNIEPSFTHHPAKTLPEFEVGEAKVKLLLGELYGHQSPVHTHSKIIYAVIHLPQGSTLKIPSISGVELAAYVTEGSLEIRGQKCPQYSMVVLDQDQETFMQTNEDSRIMLLGGESVGERFIEWNFISSSQANIETAKAEWRRGPGAEGSPFHKIAGDDQEFIPLP